MATNQNLDKTNCFRVCRLLLDGGKQLLFHFLVEAIGPSSLDIFLSANQTTIHALHTKFKPIISKSQWDILYPPSGGTDKQKWDITLTTCILTNCVKLSIDQDKAIKDIRTLRNELYGHIGQFQMDQSEFSGAWTKVKQALQDGAKKLLNDPGSFDLVALVDDIENETVVSDDILKQLQQIYNEWKSTDIAVLDAVQEVLTGLAGIGTTLVSHSDDLDNIKGRINEMEHKQKRPNTESDGYEYSPDSKKPRVKGPGLKSDTGDGDNKGSEINNGPAGMMVTRSLQTEHLTETCLSQEYQDLQSDLIKYYKLSIIKTPTMVQTTYKETDISNIFVEPDLVLVDHTVITNDKSNEKEIYLQDLFQKEKSCCQQIYVSGDAGMGKTSFCKHLVDNWCQAQSPEQASRNKNIMSNLKKFDFLLFVSLRDAKDQYEIKDMIVSQLLRHTKATETVLDDLLRHNSKKCLIILDGLDEWTCHKKLSEVPGRNLLLNYTIMTLTRPWKLETIRLREKEIDQQIEIRGVKDVDNFGKKLVSIYNELHKKVKEYLAFDVELKEHNLYELRNTPILLKQLICLWFYDRPLGNTKTAVYANMVELLFEIGENREKTKNFVIEKSHSEMLKEQMPPCFKKLGRCEKYEVLLLSLGKLAFKTIFQDSKALNSGAQGSATQLVFDSSEATLHGVSEADIDVCLKVGILSQSIMPDMVCEKRSMSFLHKTFHEFFAALYVSVNGSSVNNFKAVIGNKLRSTSDLFDIADMFRFLSGMCPSLMEKLSGCLANAINGMKEIIEYRDQCRSLNTVYMSDVIANIIQTMILSCCREGSGSGQGPLYLPVPDVIIEDIRMSPYGKSLLLCLQNYSSKIRSFSLSTRSDMSKNCASVERLNAKETRYHLELSTYTNLLSLRLWGERFLFETKQSDEITWDINEKQITSLSLGNASTPNVISTIKRATMLQTLELVSVDCKDPTVATHCHFNLDLSEHKHLRKLVLEDISVESVKLNSFLHHLKMTNVHILTHDVINSLMSVLSNAHSAESICLKSVHCKGHAIGETCGYDINLSGHMSLWRLHLEDISPRSVVMSSPDSWSPYREIKMENIQTLTCDGICSLMSGISNAYSADDITLTSVHCRDHANGAECGYNLNLSGHSSLNTLHLEDISPGSVVMSSPDSCPPYLNITMKNIKTLTHDGICSLMSSISNAHSAEDISLISVHCRNHASGAECGYNLNLSGHSSLNTLHLEDISPGSVVMSSPDSCPPYQDITMKNIKTLTHDGIFSLMSVISNAHLALTISLISVHCRDHANGAECGYNLNLSGHSLLWRLHLVDISPGSVVMSSPDSCPPYREIKMENIQTLTHDEIFSLMSGISNAYSADDISLISVHCRDHANGAECAYNLNLSGHSSVNTLHLEDISPGSVVMSSPDSCPPYRKIKLENIKTLTHDGICSLMSSLSNAHSAFNISLISVHCRDHASGAECGYNLNLSGHRSLRSLNLENISPRSVVMSSPDSCPSYSNIEMKNIKTLTHDGICSLISGISNAHQAYCIRLTSVHCRDHANGAECGYNLNLSGHSLLWRLHLEDISPRSVVMSSPDSCPPYIEIKMENIKTLTHDGICSLMSSISNAHSAYDISLISVHCRDHANGAECAYNLNLSGHSSVNTLHLEDISPGSVVMSSPDSCPPYQDITMKNIKTLTHDGIFSLMSVISNAHLALTISLISVHCRDHANGAECGYNLNLSGHSLLWRLHLVDISPGSVVMSSPDSCPPYIEIKMENIQSPTHDGICSLMSGISNAYSADDITLTSVHCRDHANGAECGYDINLSGHSSLRYLHLEDISPGSVVMSSADSCPPFETIIMHNIQTLTPDGICSLMSGISNAHSAEDISLISVHCRDHANGAECAYNLNLSGHSSVNTLHLEDISPGSVVMSSPDSCPPYQDITMKNIKTLTHDGIFSLMSVISNAHLALTISLISVHCRDHANGAECGYNLNLSGHSLLWRLHLVDISPGSVVMSSPDSCPPYIEIKMENIKTLTHDEICSLMSVISNSQSTEDITVTSVHCRDHASGAECGYNLNLSGHRSLRFLYLEDISPGSVMMNSVDLCSYRNIQFKDIRTLTHNAMCSMMSFKSLFSSRQHNGTMRIESVRCVDYANGVLCGKEIDDFTTGNYDSNDMCN